MCVGGAQQRHLGGVRQSLLLQSWFDVLLALGYWVIVCDCTWLQVCDHGPRGVCVCVFCVAFAHSSTLWLRHSPATGRNQEGMLPDSWLHHPVCVSFLATVAMRSDHRLTEGRFTGFLERSESQTSLLLFFLLMHFDLWANANDFQ